MDWYLHNGVVYHSNFLLKESVLIRSGRIVALGAEADQKRQSYAGPIRDMDLQGKLVSRGFIDFHTHLREPGYETKETIATGTKAAAAGGFTNVCPMPNTNPPLDTVRRLSDFEERISQSAKVHIHPIATLTRNRKGQETVDYKDFKERGVFLFSDDGDPLKEHIAGEVFLGVQKVGGILINHLEDKALIEEGFFYTQIPAESEYLMLERDLEFVRRTGCRYHAAHLSCLESVDLIAEAKFRGLPVTAEVTPHHLTLTYDDIREPQGHFQMKPPLRSKRDLQALIDGLRSGVIDMIATDHAPHGTEKEGGLFLCSPFGVTALETTFPILYTELVLKGKLSLERLLEALTIAPAKLLELTGSIEKDASADLVVLDLERSQVVDKSRFKSKGTNSPYIGETLRGWPVLTLVAGEARYSCEY